MRRIETRESAEKKDRRNKIAIGIILVALMLLSTAGYAFFSGDKTDSEIIKVSIDGRDFYKQGDFWAFSLNNQNFYLTYLPNETGVISLSKSMRDYSGQPVYFTKNGLAEGEISRNIGSFVSKVWFACMQGENCTENWPIKNCTSNLVIIKEQDIGNNRFREEDNCVFIFSNDTIRAADAFIYKLIGVK